MEADPGPLRRPMAVERLLRARDTVSVTASPQECAALAADFGIPAIREVVGRFRVSGSPSRLAVTGSVEALVTQVCSVSLDPFETRLHEAVEIAFSDAEPEPGAEDGAVEPPDPIVNGRIDLGVVTAEFVALGLDPYPRKPGIRFETVSVGAEDSPFAALRRPRSGDA